MSVEERRRMELMGRVKAKEITLRKAGELLEVSYRQAKRLWKAFRRHGDKGMIHGLRGRASVRAKPKAFKKKVLNRYQKRYGDFGAVLACEHLARDGMELDHETLRRWLIAAGLWQRKRERKKHRQWRARKEHLGELVQLDGSHHDWFEGRGEWVVLMVMVDDATNRTYARFFEEETTKAAYGVFKEYVLKHGLPQCLYVDRDSIYKSAVEPSLEEQLGGRRAETQFGRAMKQLGVGLKLAYSPQAKGRVERMNGVLQDRLVKEMRLAKINNIEGGNAFLENGFLEQLNERMVAAAREADLHRPVAAGIDLNEALSWEEKRHVGQDWTVRWEGRWFQITKENQGPSLANKKIMVRLTLGGQVQLIHEGKKLKWKELPQRPERKPSVKKKNESSGGDEQKKQSAGSPWRNFGIAAGKAHWRRATAERAGA